jgi:hypothetical protein
MSSTACPISLEPIPDGHAITISDTTFDISSLLGLLLVNGASSTHPHTRKPFSESDLRSIYAVAVINEQTRILMHDKGIRNINDFFEYLRVTGEQASVQLMSSSLQQAYETRWGAMIDRLLYDDEPVHRADLLEVLRVYTLVNGQSEESAVDAMARAIDRRQDELIHGGALADEAGLTAYARLEDLKAKLYHGGGAESPLQNLLGQLLRRVFVSLAPVHVEVEEADVEVDLHIPAAPSAPHTPAAPSAPSAPSAPHTTTQAELYERHEITVPPLTNTYLDEWREFVSGLSAVDSVPDSVIHEKAISTCAAISTVLKLTNSRLVSSTDMDFARILNRCKSLMLQVVDETCPDPTRVHKIRAFVWEIIEIVMLNVLLQSQEPRLVESVRNSQPLVESNLFTQSPFQNAIVRLLQMRLWNLALSFLKILKALETPSYETALHYTQQFVTDLPH